MFEMPILMRKALPRFPKLKRARPRTRLTRAPRLRP